MKYVTAAVPAPYTRAVANVAPDTVKNAVAPATTPDATAATTGGGIAKARDGKKTQLKNRSVGNENFFIFPMINDHLTKETQLNLVSKTGL